MHCLSWLFHLRIPATLVIPYPFFKNLVFLIKKTSPPLKTWPFLPCLASKA